MGGIAKTTTRERLDRRTRVMPNGCIVFQGYVINSGYALMYDGRTKTKRLVHRIAYELAHGPIPEGMQIDHVAERGCVFKTCVNPDHLEAVTPLVNTRRAIGDRTHCIHGHKFTPENTRLHTRRSDGGRIQRICRACDRDRAATYRERRSAA
jgi:hypothetical protein